MVPDEVAPGETHPAVNVEARIRNKSRLLCLIRWIVNDALAPPLALLATRSWKIS
ncbi:hypothetical protein CK203_040371 [Vitis vinifera]|uniref:Uncharacterized protein n=1 Tax=Vitis vinifera TaxID=29760 RepID=A0A438FX77_VITVI|nr:hypothetical protein CK203_040371 [Vitis vinifera]